MTDLPLAEVAGLRHDLAAGSGSPMGWKKRLAHEIVSQFHSPADADAAQSTFERQVQRRELPEEIPDFAIEQAMNIVDFVVASGMASSKSEARRLIGGGGVYIIIEGNKTRIDDPATQIDPAESPIVQGGKRRFARARQK